MSEARLVYRQATGEMVLDGHFEGLGYSGRGLARNDPDMETLADFGPIPRGKYFVGIPRESERLGPLVFDLVPNGHDAHGRKLFRIHGDNQNHDASHGCIVCGRSVRVELAKVNVTELEVI